MSVAINPADIVVKGSWIGIFRCGLCSARITFWPPRAHSHAAPDEAGRHELIDLCLSSTPGMSFGLTCVFESVARVRAPMLALALNHGPHGDELIGVFQRAGQRVLLTSSFGYARISISRPTAPRTTFIACGIVERRARGF
jgi:hypothetical protein